MKHLFRVTIHNPKHGDEDAVNVLAKNDVEARAKAVAAYVKSWNGPYKDKETGKMVSAPQIKESDLYCEIELKASDIK